MFHEEKKRGIKMSLLTILCIPCFISIIGAVLVNSIDVEYLKGREWSHSHEEEN